MQEIAFIFDMDGTIVDSMPTHVHSWIQALGEYGHHTTADDLHRNNWGNVYDVVRSIMGAELEQEQVTRIAERKETIFRETFKPEMRLIPGLNSFLTDTEHHGIPMALATNAGWDNINFVLDGLSIRKYFQTIVSGVDVQNAKPHPEMFVLAASRLNTPESACIVFEDSANGVQAASAAGMQVILVKTFSRAQPYDNHPSIILKIQDFREIGVEELVSHVKES
jgi:beta-phosphoglucomutase family hydrolase